MDLLLENKKIEKKNAGQPSYKCTFCLVVTVVLMY